MCAGLPRKHAASPRQLCAGLPPPLCAGLAPPLCARACPAAPRIMRPSLRPRQAPHRNLPPPPPEGNSAPNPRQSPPNPNPAQSPPTPAPAQAAPPRKKNPPPPRKQHKPHPTAPPRRRRRAPRKQRRGRLDRVRGAAQRPGQRGELTARAARRKPPQCGRKILAKIVVKLPHRKPLQSPNSVSLLPDLYFCWIFSFARLAPRCAPGVPADFRPMFPIYPHSSGFHSLYPDRESSCSKLDGI